MEFIVEYLKKNKKAAYADVRSAAEAKKIQVYPIMYGRAQALLGLVESKPRGQGKAALAKAGKQADASIERRGPGRPPKSASSMVVPRMSVDTSSLDGIIAAVKNSENAKERYRSALQKIQSILGSALA